MKLGVCGGAAQAEMIRAYGFDYVEETLNRIASMEDAAFAALAARYEAVGLPVYAYNGFFAWDMRLYSVELSAVRAYVERAFARAVALGGKVAVLGNGGARNIPEGMAVEAAKARFAEILAVCGECAEKHGMRIAVEPLRRAECNFIHTVADGCELAERSGSQAVGALVDFFHFHMNGEADDGLLCAQGRLYHAHIARPAPDRGVPTADDMPTLRKWAQMLSDIGYDVGLSLECSHSDDYEGDLRTAAETLTMFREV